MKTLCKLISLLAISVSSLPVMAHGDHTVVTPDHGLEHAFYYGAGIIAGLLVLRLARKVLKQKNDQ